MMGRRDAMRIGAVFVAFPKASWAARDADGDARARLDRAMGEAAADRVGLLKTIEINSLSLRLQIDVEGALAGAQFESDLRRAFPFVGDNLSPFAVTPTEGAWRKAGAAGGAAIVRQIDRETERVQEAASAGIGLPSSVVPALVSALEAATAKATDSAVSAALLRQRGAVVSAAAAMQSGDGLGRSRRGPELYAALVQVQAGEPVDPARLHSDMATLCDALSRRCDRLIRRHGLTRGSVADRLRAFARDPRFLYSDDDSGRDRAVADMNGWLGAAKAALPRSFGVIPNAADTVRVRRMIASDERAARSGYRVVPMANNGYEGGYFVDLSHIRQRPTWSLRSVVHHELLPGHMMQLPLQDDAHPHPLRLRAAPGFVEGWGVYAEQLAADAGAFADDSLGEIGYLQWMMFRAGRAWMESGIHLHGWMIVEALKKLADLQGDPVIFAPFEKDVVRAALNPGEFAGQAWNWQCLSRLAASAGALGSPGRREMHDHILRWGAMPLATLRHVLSR